MAEAQSVTTPATHDGNATKNDAPALDSQARLEQAQAITRSNVLWALGAGVVPFPIIDVLAVMAVHVKMLREFSKLYDVKFTEGVAKKLVATLVSSIGVVGVGTAIGGSLAKLIPGIGTTLSLISVPVIAGAVTHAMGQVFVMHFEAGGTLLDFDPQVMRDYFKKEFEQAKETVAQLQRNHQAKTGNKPA